MLSTRYDESSCLYHFFKNVIEYTGKEREEGKLIQFCKSKPCDALDITDYKFEFGKVRNFDLNISRSSKSFKQSKLSPFKYNNDKNVYRFLEQIM